MTRKAKVLLPLAVLGVGVLGAVGMIAARPDVKTRPPEHPAPLVRVVSAQPEDIRLTVHATGTVAPRTESDLASEVAGTVVSVAPSFAAGGFFEAGDVLVRIDRRDYENALARAEAVLARRRSELKLAKTGLARTHSLANRKVISDSNLDQAENTAQVAEAALREAEAVLRQARTDLERTEIRAPFAGRVREKRVDVGQFVTRGITVARVYAVDYAEVRLPIPDRELAFLDLPLAYRGENDARATPEVHLSADFAGRTYIWQGRITRTEGTIDPRSRMVHAIAKVDDPYHRGKDPSRPPLAVGMFVEAEITGRRVQGVTALPRAALRGADRVLIVDNENRLRFRTVDVLRTDRDKVIIRGGLAAGAMVCVSPLEVVSDGMRVRVAPVAGPATKGAESERAS